MGDAARPGCIEGDDAGTGVGTMSDTHRPERTEDKIDIIMLDKTNKIAIHVSY